MNDQMLSTCEKNFVIKCLSEKRRLDGRQFNEFRDLHIHFGVEWGCAFVSLGETKVLAQVSCEITQPRATRPSEGILYINVNSGQDKRSAEHIVLLSRHLERALKESRCVDLESLCIKSEEKVWKIRVDVNIMNHEGNLTDCASVAALAALSHFKHPDVTVSGDEIKIHTENERDPIPIVLHHHPVCVSFAIYENGEIAIADPSLLEERRSEAMLVFGINAYRELCGLHFGGITLASLQLVIQCSNQGAKRAKHVVNKIKNALELDAKSRQTGEPHGFRDMSDSNQLDTCGESRLLLRLPKFRLNTTEEVEAELAEMKIEQAKIKKLAEKNSAVLLPAEELTDQSDDENGEKWIPEPDNDSSDEEEQDEEMKEEPPKASTSTKHQSRASKVKKKSADDMSDSEEEETVMLEQMK